MTSTRRTLLGGFAAMAGLSPVLTSASSRAQDPRPAPPAGRGAQNPNVAFDLVIKGGRVIDPATRVSGAMDVAVKGDKIAAVSANIPATEGRAVFDAAGKIVTAGLIDSHGHVYDGGIATSIDADLVGVQTGVTTIVDAGSAGAANFAGMRKHVIEAARTRVYSLLNIGMNGCCNNEIYGDPRLVDARAAITTIEANRPYILGIKVRIHGRHDELAHDVEVLKKAREAADATNLPIMMHWSNEPDLLGLLKKGDIVTHPFNPPGENSSNLMGGEPGKILPQVLALKDRGIWTDFSHGSHLAWGVAEESARQKWFPDLISTDIHSGNVLPRGPVVDLATTITKFLLLGMPLEDVIAAVTWTPTKVFGFKEKIGNLAPGSLADITVSELRSGDFSLFDSQRAKRVGHQKFVPVATFKSGALLYWEP